MRTKLIIRLRFWTNLSFFIKRKMSSVGSSLLVSLATHALLAILLLALCSPGPTLCKKAPDNIFEEQCNFFLHKEKIQKGNCSAEIPLLSCEGKCYSEAVPRIFYSRYVNSRELASYIARSLNK